MENHTNYVVDQMHKYILMVLCVAWIAVPVVAVLMLLGGMFFGNVVILWGIMVLILCSTISLVLYQIGCAMYGKDTFLKPVKDEFAKWRTRRTHHVRATTRSGPRQFFLNVLIDAVVVLWFVSLIVLSQ